MMLSDIRDYFTKNFGWNESVSIGKIDQNKDIAVCFYDSKQPRAKETAIGGKKNKSYTVKPVAVLLRFGTNAKNAEQKAEEIYNFFDEKTIYINEKRVFIISRYDSAIALGTDEKGIYEYSFYFDFYETKG